MNYEPMFNIFYKTGGVAMFVFYLIFARLKII